MLRVGLLAAVIFATPALALAQTQAPSQTPAPSQTEPPPLTPLPAPPLDDNAPPRAFIIAAQHSLAAGRDGEAEEAIERAESRLLTRSVKPSLARRPDQKPLIQQLGEARRALAAGDRLRAVGLLEAAAKNPEAGGKAQ